MTKKVEKKASKKVHKKQEELKKKLQEQKHLLYWDGPAANLFSLPA